MNYFKQLLFSVGFAGFLFASCEETVPPPAPVIVKDTVPEEVMVTDADGSVFPWLFQKNYAAFLLQYGKENPETKVVVHTEYGDITLELYEDTPLHRANFIMMAKRGYFDGTFFFRVVKNFIIQGGNNDEDSKAQQRMNIGSYQIQSEFLEHHFHKRGALAMARNYNDNPKKESNPYNFYIVYGQKLSDNHLNAVEDEGDFRFPAYKRAAYTQNGGTPHLDNEHTVFGELVSGLETVRLISLIPTDESDWPEVDVVMQVEVLP